MKLSRQATQQCYCRSKLPTVCSYNNITHILDYYKVIMPIYLQIVLHYKHNSRTHVYAKHIIIFFI